MDSGATSHMTNQVRFFSTLRSINNLVYLANGSSVTATGIGSGYLQCKLHGKLQRIQLHDVLYVPKLDDSLLSVKRVIEKGYKMVIGEDGCKIYKDKRVVAEAESDGILYRIKAAKPKISAYTAQEEVCIHQWHRRLGHRDPAAIKNLISKELATGIRISPCSDQITCEKCIKGKLTQAKFSENQWRENEPMKLIYSDICGPMQTTTPSGNRYFLSLIDDHSRFTVMRLIKTKDQVAGAIKEYIAAMTTRFGRKPVALRTDNGREYISRELEEFCGKKE